MLFVYVHRATLPSTFSHPYLLLKHHHLTCGRSLWRSFCVSHNACLAQWANVIYKIFLNFSFSVSHNSVMEAIERWTEHGKFTLSHIPQLHPQGFSVIATRFFIRMIFFRFMMNIHKFLLKIILKYSYCTCLVLQTKTRKKFSKNAKMKFDLITRDIVIL